MSEQRGFKGVWIPASIWNHPNLSWLEKCLVAEIDSLSSSEHGPCSASAEFLANRMGSTPSSMRNMLAKLTLLGILKRLGTDGRFTLRCVAPGYSSDTRYNPQVTAGVTHRVHQLSLPGDTESTSIDTNGDNTPLLSSPRNGRAAVLKSRPQNFEELREYVVGKLRLPINDAAALWDHWKGNGFTNNHKPMKDWKSVASCWERCDIFFPSRRVQKKP